MLPRVSSSTLLSSVTEREKQGCGSQTSPTGHVGPPLLQEQRAEVKN